MENLVEEEKKLLSQGCTTLEEDREKVRLDQLRTDELYDKLRTQKLEVIIFFVARPNLMSVEGIFLGGE